MTADVLEHVCRAVEVVLGTSGVDPAANFFDLGGDSLSATAVQHELLDRHGVVLPAVDILGHPVVRDFAARAAPRTERPDPPPSRPAGPVQSGLLQDRILHIELIIPESPFFTNLTRVELTGPYRADLALLAIERLLHRHDVLRSRFHRAGEGWRIEQPTAVRLPVRDVDLRNRAEPDAAAAFDELSRTELATGFDLAADGPLRVTLCYLPNDRLVLMISTHHVVFDGISRGILIDEVCRDYDALVAGTRDPVVPRPATQYADFARQQRAAFDAATVAEEVRWWRERLAVDALAGTDPATLGRSEDYISANVPVRVSPDDAARLRALARSNGCTLFVTLLAGFAAAVVSTSGRLPVHIATLVANRRHEGIARCIGLFANTVVLRIEALADRAFADHLRDVRETVLAALDHDSLPLEILLDHLGVSKAARAELLGIGFALHGAQSRPRAAGGCLVTDLGTGNDEDHDIINPSTFGATLELREVASGGIEGFLQCGAAYVHSGGAQALADRTLSLLAAAADAPHSTLAQLAEHAASVALSARG